MKNMELLFVSVTDDGKMAVRTAMENIHKAIVEPKRKINTLNKAVTALEALHDVPLGDNVTVAAESLLKEIYVSQGISKERVAMEGFGDLLKTIRKAITGKDENGVKPTDRKPGAKVNDHGQYTPEGKKAVEELKSYLKKYYLNDYWLDGQTFNEGMVKADDFSKAFEVDGKVGDPFANIDLAVKRTDDFSRKWSTVLEETDKQVQKIDEETKKAAKGVDPDSDEASDILKNAIKKLEALAPLKKLPKFEGTALGNSIPVADDTVLAIKAKMPPKGVDELKALTKDQVKKAASIILSIYEHRLLADVDFNFSWLDHSDGDEFNDWIDDVSGALADDYYKTYYHQHADSDFTWDIGDLINDHKLASALERWIDRSIK